MKYRLIDHTADFGIHVFGADIKALFETAARAMFDILVDHRTVKGSKEQQISLNGSDWPDLMANWLRELLYLWTGEALLVERAGIVSISEYKLSAIIMADPFDSRRHEIQEEIKAVTYHQLDVYEGSTGWESKIIFDV
jgi:SHS2 domain-containing protein